MRGWTGAVVEEVWQPWRQLLGALVRLYCKLELCHRIKKAAVLEASSIGTRNFPTAFYYVEIFIFYFFSVLLSNANFTS